MRLIDLGLIDGFLWDSCRILWLIVINVVGYDSVRIYTCMYTSFTASREFVVLRGCHLVIKWYLQLERRAENGLQLAILVVSKCWKPVSDQQGQPNQSGLSLVLT